MVIDHHVMDDAAGNAIAPARLRLVVDPGVVLGLERLRETGEGGGAEQVREPVAARELGVHPAVDERDVEGVVVDLDLAVLGRGPLRGQEVVLERDVADVLDGKQWHGSSPV